MKNNDLYKIYGIIGSSLNHSLSPIMHNYFFRKKKLNCTYTAFEIKPINLREAISGVRSLGISGVNITFPYKQKVIRYLNELDSSARITGAVNTIKNIQGVLTGYNTDLYGVKKTLTDRLKFNPRGKNIIILGAGGAARACIRALPGKRPDTILILNRNSRNSASLIKSFTQIDRDFKGNIKGIANIRSIDRPYHTDLIINATSAGKDYVRKILEKMSRRNILKNTIFYDLNYGDRALSEELPGGITKSVDGLYMLAAQASKCFQIWTGITILPRDIFNFLKRKLRRK